MGFKYIFSQMWLHALDKSLYDLKINSNLIKVAEVREF